jgi:hypothetical protein
VYEITVFKFRLKNWLATEVDCAKTVDSTCDPIFDIHATKPLIKALNINAIFIRSLFDTTARQADVLIYSSEDPDLAMVGVYNNIDGMCWIAFRGTMTEADVKIDLNDTLQIEGPTGDGLSEVHMGMFNLYSELRPKILAAVPANVPISLCGHSLGAALAIYASFDFPNSPVYAFAPPRTGNVAFANSAPKNIISVINIADIVPTLPWSYTFTNLQYAHVGKIISFNQIGSNILDCHNLLTYYKGLKLKL